MNEGKDELARNPSPPPMAGSDFESAASFEQNRIGSTCYEKRFVLGVLLDVLKESQSSSNSVSGSPQELDDGIEQDLCQLWDMSTDEEVGSFLVSSDVLDIFAVAISRTNKPRLAEILVGVLANVVCGEEGCAQLANEDALVEVTVGLLSCRDTQTLVEATRLLSAVMNRNAFSDKWQQVMVRLQCWSDLTFILSSTTNERLLMHTSQVVSGLLDLGNYESSFGEYLLSNADSWKCLLEALIQAFNDSSIEAVASLLYSIQSFISLDQLVATNLMADDVIALRDAVGRCFCLIPKAEQDDGSKTSVWASVAASIFFLWSHFEALWLAVTPDIESGIPEVVSWISSLDETTHILPYKEAALQQARYLSTVYSCDCNINRALCVLCNIKSQLNVTIIDVDMQR